MSFQSLSTKGTLSKMHCVQIAQPNSYLQLIARARKGVHSRVYKLLKERWIKRMKKEKKEEKEKRKRKR